MTRRLSKKDLKYQDRVLLSIFYEMVCERAEENMRQTHKVEGMHWVALQQVLKELEVTDDFR